VGTSKDVTGAEVRELAAETAGQLRTLLDEIKAGDLGCSAAYRNRVEGAVLALETLTGERASFPGPAPAEG